jgi:hypothetical protein
MHLPIVARIPLAAAVFDDRLRVVHRLHRQHRRRAAGQELVTGKAGRGRQRRGRVRRLHRPDACAEPLEQSQIVRVAAKQVWHRWT